MMAATPVHRAQTLLIDADDTLWENNAYFERAIASFAERFGSRYPLAEIRVALDEAECEAIASYGYGSGSFGRALVRCGERLSAVPLTEDQRAFIQGLTRSVAEYPVDLMPGVAETLPRLAALHRLILVTKGDAREQTAKLGRSGLCGYFRDVEILREKDMAAYCGICERYSLNPTYTWMIGNSPRSDVNPALVAGLHAVYIHYPGTWAHEREDLANPSEGQRLVKVEDFAALAEVFRA